MIRTKETCATCIYFEEKKKECRMFNPTVLLTKYNNPRTHFPTVQSTDWCGGQYDVNLLEEESIKKRVEL